jgi:hypothetical protein
MANPTIPQGTLNRLKSSVILPGIPALNITSAYMSKQFVSINFEGSFDNLIPTATGGVTSPEPYVFATITVGILRTQALATAWKTQSETLSDLGNVSVFPDTSAYPEYDLVNCTLQHIEPAAFDGVDPVVRVVIRGIYYINNSLWAI